MAGGDRKPDTNATHITHVHSRTVEEVRTLLSIWTTDPSRWEFILSADNIEVSGEYVARTHLPVLPRRTGAARCGPTPAAARRRRSTATIAHHMLTPSPILEGEAAQHDGCGAAAARDDAPRAARTSASLAGARPAPPPPPCTPSPQAILPARIVESEVVQNILPFIGNAAYLALASGFVMTDLLTLRVMLVGGYSGLVVYHTLHPRPLRIPLRWSALFVAVNAAMAFKLATELWPPGLTEEELNLHRAFFNQLTPAQFKTLLDLGERRVLSTGTRLTTERVACSHLYFVEERRRPYGQQ